MNAPFRRPIGCPAGVDPADWRKALVDRIEQQAAVLSALVDALDVFDGDPDLEPSLGWTKTMAMGNCLDLEEQYADEVRP